MDVFRYVVSWLCQILAIIIFARAIVSWFAVSPYSPAVRFLNSITEPILRPLRRVVPRFGAVDITPMVAIIILLLIGRLVWL